MTQGDDLGLHSGTSPKANEEGIQKHQYKVEHSGKKATRLGRNSNNSNADVIFRKDSLTFFWKDDVCADNTGVSGTRLAHVKWPLARLNALPALIRAWRITFWNRRRSAQTAVADCVLQRFLMIVSRHHQSGVKSFPGVKGKNVLPENVCADRF